MTTHQFQNNRDGPDFLRLYRENHDYRALVNQSIAPILERYSGCVLDAGCGSGLIASLLQRGGFEVMGIDNDKPLIIKARDDFPMVSFLAENLEDFVRIGWYVKFDFILCLNIIEELKDPKTIVGLMKYSRKFMVVVARADRFTSKQLKDLFKDFRVEKLDLGLTKGAFNGLIIYAKKKGKKT